MSIVSENNVQRILDAGLTLFSRHGFKRTSMADIAREAGVARATLYLKFADKRAVFAALVASGIDEALAAAAAAWQADAPLAQNLAAVIFAKDLRFFRLLRATPHGAELFDLDADLVRTEAARLDAGFQSQLVAHAQAAERAGANLDAFGGAQGFATFLGTTAAGLKYECRTEADYNAAVIRLAAVTAAAAGT